MSRKLYVSTDISIDEAVAEIAEEDPVAALLWPWLLVHLDDWGRSSASERRLKAAVAPMMETITTEVIRGALERYATHGLIALYEVDGQEYLAVNPEKWWRYQTHIHKSKRDNDQSLVPAPPAGVLRKPRGISRNHAEPRGESRDSARNCASPPPSTHHPPPTTHTTTYTTTHTSSGETLNPCVSPGAEEAPKRTDDPPDIDFGGPDSDTTQPPTNGNRPKNGSPPDNAGTMVAFLVDYAGEIGFTLTGSKKGHFARAIGDIWKAGVDPEILRRAIRQALEENKSPAHLVDVVNDLKGGGRGKARRDSGRSQHGEWE